MVRKNTGVARSTVSCSAFAPPLQPGRLVVVAPHPDDETLGAGGLLHDLGTHGWSTSVVVVSDGGGSHVDVPNLVSMRAMECRRACSHLGVDTLTFLNFADGSLSNFVEPIAARLAPIIEGASLVVGPRVDDGHNDHRACASALEVSVTQIKSPLPMRAHYGVWAWANQREGNLNLGSSTRFLLSFDGRRAKRAALDEYVSQFTDLLGRPIVPIELIDVLNGPSEVFW